LFAIGIKYVYPIYVLSLFIRWENTVKREENQWNSVARKTFFVIIKCRIFSQKGCSLFFPMEILLTLIIFYPVFIYYLWSFEFLTQKKWENPNKKVLGRRPVCELWMEETISFRKMLPYNFFFDEKKSVL
jgi:hypothetical protein